MGKESGIGYDMIICHGLMLQLYPKSEFGRQTLEWDETVSPMNEIGRLIGKPSLTQRKIREVVMQTT